MIVDVLSFSTCVDIAVGRGACVFPFAETGDAARAPLRQGSGGMREPAVRPILAFSRSLGAGVVAGADRPSLAQRRRPLHWGGGNSNLHGVPPQRGRRRAAAARLGLRIAVIAAGERWPSGGLRPALEDWLGAGVVAAALDGRRSPEAQAACQAFEAATSRIESALLECVSGCELVERGFAGDVALASQLNVSQCAPRLSGGEFRDDARAERS